MKTAKTITDAIAIMLAIFIFIYVFCAYLKFNPTEKALEETSKLDLFIKDNETNNELFHLSELLFVSGLLGFAFRKKPEITVLTSLLSFSFALTLYNLKMITKHPMVITILCLSHLIGAIVYCGYLDRGPDKNMHSSRASTLCSIAGLTTGTYVLIKLNVLRSFSEAIKSFSEAGLKLSNKVLFNKKLLELIKMRFDNYGSEEAADLAADFNLDIEMSSLKLKMLNNFKEEQFKYYLSALIIIFAAMVLYFYVSRTRFRFIGIVLALIPAVYVIINVHTANLSALPLPLMCSVVASFICAFAGYDQRAKGHDDGYDVDCEPSEEVSNEDSGETTYT